MRPGRYQRWTGFQRHLDRRANTLKRVTARRDIATRSSEASSVIIRDVRTCTSGVERAIASQRTTTRLRECLL